jgi:Na+/proline symporter
MFDLGIEIIFVVTLLITFVAAYLGRRHTKRNSDGLTNQQLNRWLIGLSAGATANSGFIVTGAVGLGYTFGPQWLFLPISWFLGDLIFWKFCPERINRAGDETRATTLSELLGHGLSGKFKRFSSVLATLLIVICLAGYTSAQWLAGQKFITGAFEISSATSLLLFAVIIIAYTSIGGFRGSVYADSVQAVIRIFGTAIALGAAIYIGVEESEQVWANWNAAGENYLSWVPGASLISATFFVVGYAFAAFGFGLGQPQLVSRYLAGSSPEETKAAKWIYISFVQFTWISMTIFGVLLRGIMPEIDDPETGLSVFIRSYFGTILTGIIVADIFATIAATSNSLLVAMSQAVIHDFFPRWESEKGQNRLELVVVLLLGAITMLGAVYLAEKGSVFTIALGSVSLMGAGLAAPVLIKIFDMQRTSLSLFLSIATGFVSAIVWKFSAVGPLLNEAAVGFIIGLIVNQITCKLQTSDRRLNSQN